MRYLQPSLFLPFLASAGLVAPSAAFAERLPLTPHVAKIEVTDPRFTLTTESSGDFVIRYKGEDGQLVKVVYAPPSKVRTTVAATAEVDTAGNFTFRYELVGMPDSPQAVGSLVVEFQGAVVGVASPPGWASTPLGFLSAISWHPGLDVPAVLPGARLKGFAMSASAKPVSEKFQLGGKDGYFHFEGTLPGIVACHAGGATEVLAFPDEPPFGLEEHFPFFPEDGVGGRTIGPVTLPIDGQIPWLIERLASYAEESHQLGWLDDPARLQKYLLLIDQVGRQVDNQSFQLGQQMLQAFRRQVELDFKLGFLTSESYALFLHNSSYLEKLLAKAR